MEIIRNRKILRREETALLVIDIQERILKAMMNSEELIANSKKLISGFGVMNVPIFYTEQYPKGLGNTVPELKELLEEDAIAKLSFSCFGAGDLFETLVAKRIKQVVVAGIESHVCVQQTVLDLLANDFQVNLVADAVSSRKEKDYLIALDRMRANGAELVTTETVLFELLQVCGTDEFKAVSKLIK